MRARLLLAVLAVALSPALYGQDAPGDDVLVLELRLGRQVLAEGITGYVRGTRVLLPLGEVVRALDFAIDVDPAAGTAGGWFLREDRRFSLDCAHHLALSEGRSLPFDPAQALRQPEDLYVDSALLGVWFPVRFDLDLPHLAAVLVPREKLPLELRLEREARAQSLRQGAEPGRKLPVVETPYRLLDWPAIEGTVTWSRTAGTGGQPGASLVQETHWSGDLLGMTGDLRVSSGQGAGDEHPVRLSLGRRDPAGGLLGPWRTTEAALGSLFLPSHPLVFGGQPIQGVLLSSFPLDEVEAAESTTLAGDAPPGWDVELYREEALVDLQRAGADGRYLFRQVPLFLGANLFRLVFHGPQGQRREEQRRMLVGERMPRPGETRYRIVAGRLTGAPSRATSAAATEVEIGLHEGLAAAFSLDRLDQGFAGFGLRASRNGVFGRMDLVRAEDGGWAVQSSLQSLWRRFGILLQRDQYEDFTSPQTAASALDRPRARSLLRLNGMWERESARPLSFHLAVERDERTSGASDKLTASLAGGLPGLSWLNLVSLDTAPAGGPRRTTGSLLVSGRLESVMIHGELAYRIEPTPSLDQATLTAEKALGLGNGRGSGPLIRLEARRTLAPHPATAVSAAAGWTAGRARIDLGLSHASGTGWTAHLTLGFSLRRNPLTGRWQANDPARAAGGAVAAQVFLDRDGDGRFGPGDQPIPGAVIRPLHAGARPEETGARGGALLTGLPLLRPVDLELDTGSLADPAWVPVRDGAPLTLRPGTVPRLDFPVAVSGEIEGTVHLRETGEAHAAANVHLQLIDDEGAVVHEARSESDGFYLFERIPPGRYHLRIDPEQARRLHWNPPPERALQIDGAGDVLRRVNFDLER